MSMLIYRVNPGYNFCRILPPLSNHLVCFRRNSNLERSLPKTENILISPIHTSTHRSFSYFGKPRYQYTKYRISKPWTTNTTYDDIFIANPSKEDFYKFTKDTPLFLRFLKLVTDLDGRNQAFIEYMKRCVDGLVVETDVYVTKKELIDLIWENGYTESEINAFEIAFPSDFKFHYPELAVLFDLSEEDCYKFCIRKRAAQPNELVELNYKPPQNLAGSYGLTFVALWFGLSTNAIGNVWFYSKTLPFFAIFYMLCSYFYRDIREYFWKEENTLIESALSNKVEGEEAVYSQMKKYANDSKAAEYLSSFKGDVQRQLAQYHAALVERHRHVMSNRLLLKLSAIKQGEDNIQSALQEKIVREVVSSCRESFTTNPQLQQVAFDSALAMLANDSNILDPVELQFRKLLGELQQDSGSKIKSGNNLSAKINAIFEENEQIFLDNFTVKASEAAAIRTLVTKCSCEGGTFDFSRLQPSELQQLENLFETVNNRVGFEVSLPHEFSIFAENTAVEETSKFQKHIKEQMHSAITQIRQNQLSAFAKAFI